MENVFVKGICQIGVFMICAQTFVHFCPKGAYEKYLKMLVSIMVLIQIISPLGAILGGKGQNLENAHMGEWLEEVLMQSMDEVLQEGRLGLENIEESQASDDWLMDETGMVTENEIKKEVECVGQEAVQIYIEPIDPIKVGQ